MIDIQGGRRSIDRGRRAAAMAAAWLAAGHGPAHAALGGRPQSVDADRVHLSARMVSTVKTTFTAHALSLPNGGEAREFVGVDGVVFAVSWSGPSRPDLRQLLGDGFAALQADNPAPAAAIGLAGRRGARGRRAPLAVDRPDLIVRTAGHPGAFSGAAYLPGRLPAGFSVDDLR